MAAGTNSVSGPVRAQLISTVASASLNAPQSRFSSSRDSRRKRRAEKRAAAAAGAQQQQGQQQQPTELDIDADEDDTQARSVMSPVQLIRGIADMQLISPRGPR
jgi:hypothetical protein